MQEKGEHKGQKEEVKMEEGTWFGVHWFRLGFMRFLGSKLYDASLCLQILYASILKL